MYPTRVVTWMRRAGRRYSFASILQPANKRLPRRRGSLERSERTVIFCGFLVRNNSMRSSPEKRLALVGRSVCQIVPEDIPELFPATRPGDRGDRKSGRPKHRQRQKAWRQEESDPLSSRADTRFRPIFHDDSMGYPWPAEGTQ